MTLMDRQKWRLRKVAALSAPRVTSSPCEGRRSGFCQAADFLIAKTVAFSPDDSCIARIASPNVIVINALSDDRLPGCDKIIKCRVPVTSLAFGPRPNDSLWRRFSRGAFTLATGHRNGTIRLWDSSSTQILTTLASHRDQVNDLMFVLPMGESVWALISVGSDCNVKIWDAEQHHDYNMSCSVSARLPLASCTFNPVGNLLAVAGNGRDACILNVHHRDCDERLTRRLKRLTHLANIVRVRYTLDGAFLLTASVDTTVKMWDSYSGELKRTFCYLNPRPLIHFPVTIGDLSLDSSGMALASITRDGMLRIWDPQLKQLTVDPSGAKVDFQDAEITQCHEDGSRYSISFSNQGQALIVVDQNGRGHIYVLEISIPKLSHLCRTAIRKSLHHDKQTSLDLRGDVHIPQRVKMFLKYES